MPVFHALRLAGVVAEHIYAQHDGFEHFAFPLSPRQKELMAGFFTRTILRSVRITVLVGMKLENPLFYPALRQMGFANLPDFSNVEAMTFDNVVVSHQFFTDSLLFHELVHVEQFRQLGVERFAELYVRGFMNGGGYDGIPLERNAYELQARFDANQLEKFSVKDEVRTWIAEDRF